MQIFSDKHQSFLMIFFISTILLTSTFVPFIDAAGNGNSPNGKSQKDDSTNISSPDGKETKGQKDKDLDGFSNGKDNCPKISNPDQTDTDGDGVGDACDSTPGTEPDPDPIHEPEPNSPPVANNQNISLSEDTSEKITLIASDVDGNDLTFSVMSGPLNGELTGKAPNLIFMPNPHYSGNDSFTFKANDGYMDSNLATVSLAINSVNDTPIADVGGPYSGTAGDLFSFDGSNSDDIDGDTLEYFWDFGDGNTGTGVNPTHTFANGGTYTITLTVSDGFVDSSPDTTSANISEPIPEPEPTPEKSNPVITEVRTVSNGILISWIQEEPVALSYDIIIDGVDTNSQYRTASSPQVVESGECFSVQARYPEENILLNSGAVCLDPEPTPEPEPEPTSEGFDRFGTAHLYPSAGRIFESHWDNGIQRTLHGQERDPIDPELKVTGRNPEVVIDGNGVATMQGKNKGDVANPRMFVFDEAREKTWENTEITIYMMRVNEHETLSYAGLNVVSRSEHQDASEDPNHGQGYAGRFTYDGRTQFVKEVVHGSVYENADTKYHPWNTPNSEMPYNQWIGAKLVTYDLPDGSVKLELYMDLTDGVNGGDWKKTNEFIDDGSWESRIFSDPATSVWIKNDGLGAAKYKNFSVREIIPPN